MISDSQGMAQAPALQNAKGYPKKAKGNPIPKRQNTDQEGKNLTENAMGKPKNARLFSNHSFRHPL